jgi:hypothetical protein
MLYRNISQWGTVGINLSRYGLILICNQAFGLLPYLC